MRRSWWRRIESLFEAAQARQPDTRERFLAAACGRDASLRHELEAMLAAAESECALKVERLVTEDVGDVSDPDPMNGVRVGSWRLLGAIGRGGMGTVYRAERADGHYQQEVAVKLLRSDLRDAAAIERFRTERQVLAHLSHPNIARLLDGGITTGGTPYLVMEIVDGVPITEWCVANALELSARLRLFRVACEAVQHAHRALVVHRDLKPSNIFVSVAGDVKLLDFGLAKLLDPVGWESGASVTRAEMRMLTPEYAAPEQRQGGPTTTATDVYALGVVLYELVTGVRPVDVGSVPASIVPPSEVLRRSDGGADRRLAKEVRRDLDRVVLTALREEPERRYLSAGQLGEEIGRFLEGRPVLAQPDTLGYRTRKFVARHPLAVTAAVVFVLSLMTFGVVAAGQARALAEQSRRAQLERDKAEQVVQVLVRLFETTNPAIHADGDRMSVREFLAGAEARALAQLR
jgi:serine/threonine-protein kinase